MTCPCVGEEVNGSGHLQVCKRVEVRTYCFQVQATVEDQGKSFSSCCPEDVMLAHANHELCLQNTTSSTA